MNVTFYISAAIAVLATFMAITRREAIHGLLYLVVSLLAVAMVFLVLGAPFAAALEIITYAGAMMVMLLFAIMTFIRKTDNAGKDPIRANPRSWIGPALLTLILTGEIVYILAFETPTGVSGEDILPRQVGLVLFGPYVLAVELASMLLLAGLVGAYHLGRHGSRKRD